MRDGILWKTRRGGRKGEKRGNGEGKKEREGGGIKVVGKNGGRENEWGGEGKKEEIAKEEGG